MAGPFVNGDEGRIAGGGKGGKGRVVRAGPMTRRQTGADAATRGRGAAGGAGAGAVRSRAVCMGSLRGWVGDGGGL
jgi:hypothetical protein